MKSSKLLCILSALATALLVLSASVAAPILCRPFYYAHIAPLELTRSGLPAEEIRRLAERLLPDLAAHYADFAVSVAACQSQIGSGSLPVDRLPSAALTFTPHDGRGSRLEALAARWRALPCPVIGRIDDGRLWLDLRCLEDETRFMEMLLR